jgi:hypothetical protein
MSSVVCTSVRSGAEEENLFQKSLRLRRDGSFVIYSHDGEQTKESDEVMEGNWELCGSEIRIFGKRYTDTVVAAEYSQAVQRTPPSIFQSDLKIARFHDLALNEKEQLASLILTRVSRGLGLKKGEAAEIWGTEKVLARGTGEKEVAMNLVESLNAINPWTFRSPILADAMLPSAETGPCEPAY